MVQNMTINQIKRILEKNNLSAKKMFGQNFLLNDQIIYDICEQSNIDKSTCVIEVGPGLGFLTKELTKRAKKVLAYEIDDSMIDYLNNTFKDIDNLVIKPMDFLKANIDEDILENFSDYSKVILVANLPYYITTPILLKVLEESKLISSMTCMMQKEVAWRICGKPSTKDYNALSVLMQYYTNPKVIINVDKQSFYPEPDVDSSVVLIKYLEKPLCEVASTEYFKKFNRAIFTQRRKTLNNNLKSFGINKQIIEEVLNNNNIDLNIRAEALNVETIAKLSSAFFHATHK